MAGKAHGGWLSGFWGSLLCAHLVLASYLPRICRAVASQLPRALAVFGLLCQCELCQAALCRAGLFSVPSGVAALPAATGAWRVYHFA